MFYLLPFFHSCWRRSQQKKLWKTSLPPSWTPWNTETGWDGVTERTMQTVCLTESIVVPNAYRYVSLLLLLLLSIPGTSVGAADEGAQAGCEAEEGAGAAVQPAAHRVQPHTVRDVDAGHPSTQVPATKSHGKIQDWGFLKKSTAMKLSIVNRFWNVLMLYYCMRNIIRQWQLTWKHLTWKRGGIWRVRDETVQMRRG